MAKKCNGSYGQTGHTCINTCEVLTNLLKENKDITDNLIESFEKSLSYYCHKYYKISEFVTLYCNKYQDKDIYKIFKSLSSNFNENYWIFKYLNEPDNQLNLIRVINNFLNSIINTDVVLNNYNSDNYNNDYNQTENHIKLVTFSLEIYEKNIHNTNNIDVNLLLQSIYLICFKDIMYEDFVDDYNLRNRKVNFEKLQPTLNKFYNDKSFKANYKTFLYCLIYDSYDNGLKLLSSPDVKITKKSAVEYINMLFNISHDNFIRYKKTEDIEKSLNLFFDNDPSLDNINFNNILDKCKQCDITRYFAKNNTIKNLEIIINILVEKNYQIKLDDFLTILTAKIKINNPQKCGIDINNDKISAICYSLNFNPYNLKFDYTLELLRTECDKTGNLKKIREVCKKIKPDIICLENTCQYKNNYNTIKYICENHNINININCLAHILKSTCNGLSSYIADEYFKDKKEQENKKNDIPVQNDLKNNDLKDNKDIMPKVNSDNKDELVPKKKTKAVKNVKAIESTEIVEVKEVKTPENNEQTDSTKVTKKIIKRVVKKIKSENSSEQKSEQNTENKTEENTPQITPQNTEEKPKKIIKRIIRKVVKKKSPDNDNNSVESVESTKSTESVKEVQLTQVQLTEQKDETIKLKKIVKKKKLVPDEEKEIVNNTNVTNTNNKVLEVDNYVIPDNYNYRTKYKIKNIIKKIVKEPETNHLDARKQILDYLKNNNQLSNNIKIDNISFKFNNLDKFISLYVFEA
jgi:hypothetical protein